MRRVEMNTTEQEIVFEKFPAKVAPCDRSKNFLADKTQDAFTGNITTFTCLDNSDLHFQGTTVSPVHNYLHFELNRCEQDILQQTPGFEEAECADDQELQRFFAGHILIGYAANTFVNKTMFEESPIATLNDIVFYEQLDINQRQRKEVQLHYNEVELKDSHFRFWDEYQTENFNFISIGAVHDSSLRSINPNAIFQCQFRLSNRVIEYERMIYSFFEMAGDIGGFGEFLYVVILIFIGGYANRMFFADIIQDMFRVRLDTAPDRRLTKIIGVHRKKASPNKT